MAQTSVLIVGGGPVGLVLGIELGRRGIDCILIETRDGTINTPKMNFVNVRSMEFCRRWGLVDTVRKAGHDEDFTPNITWMTAVTEHLITRLDFPPLIEWAARGYSPETSCLCSQLWFDPILLEYARTLPSLQLRHRTRLDEFTETDDGISAAVTDLESRDRDTIEAQFIVGCDGANSTVREQLAIALDGLENMALNLHVFFESEELVSIYKRTIGQARFCWLVDESGIWCGLTSVNGRGLWRFGITPPEDDPEGAGLDIPEMIRRAVGTDFDFDVLSSRPWISRKLVADRFGGGRVYLAGDAAHQLNPSGGFGMNTGVGDAIDLAWKLSAMLDGWGGDRLLASYEAERRPIAVRNVEEATRNFRRRDTYVVGEAITDDTPDGQMQRGEFADALFANDVRRHYEVEGMALGYRYEASPIICNDGTPAPPDDPINYTPTARPAHLAPHAWLAPGVSTLDKFGEQFTLFRFGTEPTNATTLIDAADACGLPLQVIDIDNPDIAALYERDLILVRPDGHVAWRGDMVGADAYDIVDRVRGAVSKS